MFGVAFLAPLLVRPLARVLGAPLARTQGLTGRPGARERDPPAAAHRGHRRRADGRPRARRARHDLRRRPARLGRQDDRRPGLGRADRAEPGRLHADPGRRSVDRSRRCPASRRRRRCASRPASSRASTATPPSPASIPRPSAPCCKLKWDQGDAKTLELADGHAGRRRLPTGRSRTTSPSATRWSSPRRPASRCPTRSSGTFKNQAGPDRERGPHRRVDGGRLGRQDRRVRDGRGRGGRGPGRARGDGGQGAEEVPVDRRAVDRPVQEEAGRRRQPAPRPRVRACSPSR